MAIQILTVHQQLPSWIAEGIKEYCRRMPPNQTITIKTISLGKRGKKNHDQRAIQHEGQAMLDAIPDKAWVVALDEHGQHFSSLKLADEFEQWQNQSKHLVFLIGGPDGLAPDVLSRANQHWALSHHTLPHAIAQLICVEQLYRAYTILNNHPYHRN